LLLVLPIAKPFPCLLFFGASTLVDSFAQNLEFSGTFVAQSIFLIAVTSCMISYLILDNNE